MKKAFTPGNPLLKVIELPCVDAEQNQRLDMMKVVDAKHDRQFTWTLFSFLITFTWLLMLTAALALKGAK